jgi:hypothetical protein
MNRTSKRKRLLAKAGKPGKFRVPLDMGSIKGLLYLAALVAALGGVQYVISPDGNVVPYKQVSSLFPLDTLKMMIKQS